MDTGEGSQGSTHRSTQYVLKWLSSRWDVVRYAWRYQMGNQNTEGQTTQWPKEKGQKDKHKSTKHTHKAKDRVTRTSLKSGGEG